MGYKMKGFGGFGNSPAKQKKKKGKLQGPIPEQNIGLQSGEHEGTWIYGRGYKDEDPKKGLEQMKKTRQRPGGADFVYRERMGDYDERAGVIEQNELMDIEYDLKHGKKFDRKAKGYKFPVKNKKKLLAERKKLKKTIKTLDHEQQLMRDRQRQ